MYTDNEKGFLLIAEKHMDQYSKGMLKYLFDTCKVPYKPTANIKQLKTILRNTCVHFHIENVTK